MAFKRLIGALSLIPTLLHSGCFTSHYLGQQSLGQLHLLRIRRHIDEVAADPRTPPLVRERLELAMAARQFGIEVLGLRGGAEFTRYVDTGGPVAYNLTAASRTALRINRWRFPLVGSVPYLGFFKQADAALVARRLEQRGYDTYVRPVEGYSTLGYFISPIYAAMLSPHQPGPAGEARTVEVVLHEMAHSTAYIKSASELNESYATLVGIEGAARFFRERGAADESALVRQLAEEMEKHHKLFSTWLEPTLKTVEAFYQDAKSAGWTEAETLQRREALFERVRESYRAAFPSGPRYRRLLEGPLNNALLLSFGVYHQSGDTQAMLLDSVAGDLRAYINLYKQAQDRADGADWLLRLAADHKRTLPRE